MLLPEPVSDLNGDGSADLLVVDRTYTRWTEAWLGRICVLEGPFAGEMDLDEAPCSWWASTSRPRIENRAASWWRPLWVTWTVVGRTTSW